MCAVASVGVGATGSNGPVGTTWKMRISNHDRAGPPPGPRVSRLPGHTERARQLPRSSAPASATKPSLAWSTHCRHPRPPSTLLLRHPSPELPLTMLFSRVGQQQQQGQPPPPLQSWYPPSGAGPANSGPSRVPPPPPLSFGAHPFGIHPLARRPIAAARPTSGVYPPSTLAGSYSGDYPPPTSLPPSSSGSYPPNTGPSNSVASLKDTSPEELTRLLNDKDAYNAFLHSLDEVRRLDKISDALRKSTIVESKNNLAKESEIAELRTQCMIIRTTEFAASQEKFEEVEKRYKEVQANCSPPALLNKLQDIANEADEESENLHYSFLAGEIELLEFIQKYRKQRFFYYRRSLIRMAALSAMTTPA